MIMAAIFTSKWMIFVCLVILIFIILYMIGQKSVHSESFIPATPEEVWSVLIDTQNIKTWNTILIPIDGELREGASIKYEFYQDENNRSVIPAKVRQMVENNLLNQKGGMTGILTFDHKYILEPEKGGTKVIIHEDYRGIMVPFWNPAPVEQAYTRLAEALKDRVIFIKEQESK